MWICACWTHFLGASLPVRPARALALVVSHHPGLHVRRSSESLILNPWLGNESTSLMDRVRVSTEYMAEWLPNILTLDFSWVSPGLADSWQFDWFSSGSDDFLVNLVLEALRPSGILVWDGDEFAEDGLRYPCYPAIITVCTVSYVGILGKLSPNLPSSGWWIWKDLIRMAWIAAWELGWFVDRCGSRNLAIQMLVRTASLES